jgi:alpha/beta superfamily hydrolase
LSSDTGADGTVSPVPAETVLLDTADGLTLVGELGVPETTRAAAVVLHPHPLYGGDMHSFVVESIASSLVAAGAATLRFDFRGVGRSEGSHGEGVDERLDVAAALDVVHPFAGTGPLLLCGYSFGGRVALDVLDPRVDAWFAVAAPLRHEPAALAARDHRPKLLVVPEHDQFLAPGGAADVVRDWANTTVELIPGADHFLQGRTSLVAEAAATCLTRLVER